MLTEKCSLSVGNVYSKVQILCVDMIHHQPFIAMSGFEKIRSVSVICHRLSMIVNNNE